MSKSVTLPVLSEVTGIDRERLSKLDTITEAKRKEPWLDEAVLLSRALCVDGVIPLMTSGNLTDLRLGPDVGHDRDWLLSGARLPLSVACRLTIACGLPDPSLLHADRVHRQAWDILSRNERGAEPGACAWCLADVHGGQAHRATCLPSTLWARNDVAVEDLPYLPKPLTVEGRVSSGMAPGLRPLRERLELTQADMARTVGIDANHYARLERLELPLTTVNAEKVSKAHGVDVPELYRKRTDEELAAELAAETQEEPAQEDQERKSA